MRRLGRIFLVAVWAAIPTILVAQTASKDFPDDNGGGCPGAGDQANVPASVASSSMNMRLVVKGAGAGTLPHVNTSTLAVPGIPVSGCNLATEVNKVSQEKICETAVATGFTCNGVFGPAFAPCDCIPGNAIADCTTVDNNESLDINCYFGGLTSGFKASRVATGPDPLAAGAFATMLISPIAAASEIISLNHNTLAGNTVETDMLPHFLVRVRPKSILGTVQFKIYHTGAGQNPRQFAVSITSGNVNSPTAIATDITNGFNAAGLGLQATVQIKAPPVSAVFTDAGPYTYVPGVQAAGITRIAVKGQVGQDVETETGKTPVPRIPTLNPVGLALLAVFLFLGGLWLLRRRPAPSLT